MYKSVTSLGIALFAAVAFPLLGRAVVADSVFASCSTTGPDYYGDGTLVADGESYALVYTAAGKTFAGFLADGSVVKPEDSELVVTIPMAFGGALRQTLCVVPKDYYEARKDGTWELVLLDTRKVDGAPSGLGTADAVKRVNSWGRTKSSVTFGSSPFGLRSAQASDRALGAPQSDSAVASRVTELPADTPRPRITAIDVKGNRVVLNVADTVPYLTYDVAGASTPDLKAADAERVAVERKDGEYAREIELEANGSNAKFFGVVSDR